MSCLTRKPYVSCHTNLHCKVTRCGVTLADYKNKFIIFQVPFVQIFDIRNPSFVSGKFPCATWLLATFVTVRLHCEAFASFSEARTLLWIQFSVIVRSVLFLEGFACCVSHRKAERVRQDKGGLVIAWRRRYIYLTLVNVTCDILDRSKWHRTFIQKTMGMNVVDFWRTWWTWMTTLRVCYFHFQLPVLRSLQLSPRTVYVLRKRTPRQGPNQRFNWGVNIVGSLQLILFNITLMKWNGFIRS